MALLDDIIRQAAQQNVTGLPAGLGDPVVTVPPYGPPGVPPPPAPPPSGFIGSPCSPDSDNIVFYFKSMDPPIKGCAVCKGGIWTAVRCPPGPPVPFPPPLGPPIPPPTAPPSAPPPPGTPPPASGGQTWLIPGTPGTCMDASCNIVPCGPNPIPGFPPGCGGPPSPSTPPIPGLPPGPFAPPRPPPGPPIPFSPPLGPPLPPPGSPSPPTPGAPLAPPLPPGNFPGFAPGAQPFAPVQFPLWVYSGSGGTNPQSVPYGAAPSTDWSQITSFPFVQGPPTPAVVGNPCTPDGNLQKAADGTCLVCSSGRWVVSPDPAACPSGPPGGPPGPPGSLDIKGTTCDPTSDTYRLVGSLCFFCDPTTKKWISAPFKNCSGDTPPPAPGAPPPGTPPAPPPGTPPSGGLPVAGGPCPTIGEVLGDGTNCFICDSTNHWRQVASKNCTGNPSAAPPAGTLGASALVKPPPTITAGAPSAGGVTTNAAAPPAATPAFGGGSAFGSPAFGSPPGGPGPGIAPTFDEMVQNILKGQTFGYGQPPEENK